VVSAAVCECGTAAPPPLFLPMSIVASVAHLSYCWALVYVSIISPLCRWYFCVGHFLRMSWPNR